MNKNAKLVKIELTDKGAYFDFDSPIYGVHTECVVEDEWVMDWHLAPEVWAFIERFARLVKRPLDLSRHDWGYAKRVFVPWLTMEMIL